MSEPKRAEPVVLDPAVSARRALVSLARACLAHADANVDAVDPHGDPEGLHQFRVAYRRLRSLLSLARNLTREDPEAARLQAGLRELVVRTGPARDLDVFKAAHPDLSPEDAARLDKARVEAYAVIRDLVDSPEWAQLHGDLERWLAKGRWRSRASKKPTSARDFAARALTKRRRYIVGRGVSLADLSDHERHQVRIEAKKLRYGCQFFESLWPKRTAEARAMEKVLSELQDRLGALNDTVVWERIRVDLALHVEPAEPLDEEAEIARAQQLVDDLAARHTFWR